MKRVFYIVLLILAGAQMTSAQKYFDKIKISSSDDSLSYSIGLILAQNILSEGLPANPDPDGKVVGTSANKRLQD